jgi:hypothetical protein
MKGIEAETPGDPSLRVFCARVGSYGCIFQRAVTARKPTDTFEKPDKSEIIGEIIG